MTSRLAIGLVVGLAAAAVVLLGGAVAGHDRVSAPHPARAEAAADGFLAGFSPGNTRRFVEELELDVDRKPNDARALAVLGLAYLQLARETGDPRLYPRAERALTRALRAAP